MLFKEWSRPVLLLVGGLVGSVLNQGAVADEDGSIHSIRWRSSYGKAAKEAAERGQPLLVEFTATWCGACQQMQKLTFRDPRVVTFVQSGFVPLVIDADANSELVRGFRIEAFPTTLVVSPELKILKRFSGYQSSAVLLTDLNKVVEDNFATRETVHPVSATKPANTTPVAFDGFCLVSILEEHKVRQGDGQFRTTYRDQELTFFSEQHRQKFLGNPGKYWPVSNGKCLVSEREQKQETVGDPRMGVTWRGKLWLFADKEHQKRFLQAPHKYATSGI